MLLTMVNFSPVPALAGSAWKVTMMGGTAIVSGREPILEFGADGKVGGSTGCNSFFGGYVQDGAALTVSGLGSTKMMCIGQGVMEQELAFTDILSGKTALTLGDDGNLLTVKGEDGISFSGERIAADAEPSDPALLTGAEWVVEDINRTGVIDNSHLTLAFTAEGRVSGSTNCNRFSGGYSVDGNTLTFTVELGELEGKISRAADQALALELELFDDLVAEVTARTEGIATAEDVDLAVKAGVGLRTPVYGVFEHADMAGMQNVEHAVGESDTQPPFPPALDLADHCIGCQGTCFLRAARDLDRVEKFGR